MNLTLLANAENLAKVNFTVKDKHWGFDESFHTSSYLNAGDLGLRYGRDDNVTHVVFYYLSNETGVLNRFWERYSFYFNLSARAVLTSQAFPGPFSLANKPESLTPSV